MNKIASLNGMLKRNSYVCTVYKVNEHALRLNSWERKSADGNKENDGTNIIYYLFLES